MPDLDDHDIAIAHGALTGDGGAQRVAIELARTFDAPIYCVAVDDEHVPPDVSAHELLTGRWADIALSRRFRPRSLYWLGRHLYTMQRTSWLSDLHDHDVVIQSKPEMGWYIQHDEQTVVRYVHHGFRRHYSQFESAGQSPISRTWSLFFRTVSRQTADYPHLLICNSETTAQRCRDHWAVRDERLRVCYPPVAVEEFDPADAREGERPYLALGRLADNKRVLAVAETFADRDDPLVIAGDGPERERVETIAATADNIRVAGYVSEAEKRHLLASARALIMHADHEDFGITPIEAMAAGTPVIGVDEPYTCHQILDGRNGLTYDRENMHTAIDRFERTGVNWPPRRIASFADRFGRDRFRERMQSLVREAIDRSRTEPPWQARDRIEVSARVD